MTLFSLLVKRTSSSCDVTRRFDNKTLSFSQHRKNYGLLLFDFANHSLIHIFTLQNPQIMSIFPRSHHAEVDASSSPNNCNASLLKKGYAWAVACYTVHHSQCRQLLRSCGISNGPTNFIRCLARRYLYRQLRRSRADSNVS